MRMRKILAPCTVAITLAAASGAHAVEGGILSYPPGSSGVLQNDFPTFPGLFAFSQTSFTSANALYGNDGKKLDIPFSLSAYSETIRLIASYPTQVFGANIYSLIVVPTVDVETSAFHHSSSATGFGNIAFTPLIFMWDLGHNQKVTLGFDFISEIGSYNPTTTSTAVGYTSYAPVLGYRYDDPNGPIASAMVRYLMNAENDDTDYTSGNTMITDFYLGWHFGKWQVGVVGGYAKQFESDIDAGIAIGNKLETLVVGPSIAWDFGRGILNINYQQNVYAENAANSSTFWFNLAFPLWVPTSAGGGRNFAKH